MNFECKVQAVFEKVNQSSSSVDDVLGRANYCNYTFIDIYIFCISQTK